MKVDKYNYISRNLFEFPEKYEFANCSSIDFLESWKESRINTINNFKNYSEGKKTIKKSDNDDSQYIILNDYLLNLSGSFAANQISTEEFMVKVEPFLKKYEVFKILYSQYDSNLRKINNSLPASYETYIIFGNCLAEIVMKVRSLKHLSTLLKICDALASVPTKEFSALEVSLALKLFEKESRLIQKIET